MKTPRFDERCVGKPPLLGKRNRKKIQNKERELKKQGITGFETNPRGNRGFMMVGLERETEVCPSSFKLQQVVKAGCSPDGARRMCHWPFWLAGARLPQGNNTVMLHGNEPHLPASATPCEAEPCPRQGSPHRPESQKMGENGKKLAIVNSPPNNPAHASSPSSLCRTGKLPLRMASMASMASMTPPAVHNAQGGAGHNDMAIANSPQPTTAFES